MAEALPNRDQRPLYLDYQATTPVDPRVLEAMLPFFTEHFANPHSVEHAPGRFVAEAMEEARAELARLINAEPREVIFTSGATESNNLAIKGAVRFRRNHEGRDRLVTLATEHKCVLESAEALGREGCRVTLLPVCPDGLVDLAAMERAIDGKTALVSVMAVNNEIGVVQPLAEIARLAHAKGAWLHSDAAQAIGKISFDVRALDLDLVSISGHKMYAPKGIGALYVRRRPRVRLEPLFDGGGQERTLRSGTLPAPLVVGLGRAAAIAREELESEQAKLWRLHRRLKERLRKEIPGIAFNGSAEARIPGNLNVTLPGVDAQALLKSLPELALSTGSACTSTEVEPSHVLHALGLSDADAAATLRIGFGRFTTEADVDFAAERLIAAQRQLRAA
ncbi:MAG TPA: aminotransferase class V-fold PLP-dependent enzyme [Kiloniellales bacterium]|nr:aminotransferase class V-fold PLP-dependent enzyme [Kiloniellales bacterium]